MDGDWETVKAKPKAQKKPEQKVQKKQYGGITTGGMLIAGPIRDANGASNIKQQDYSSLNNQASNIADYDYNIDNEQYDERQIETVSHVCAQAIAEARMAKKWTQEKLAHAIGEKTSVIVDIEAGTGAYKGSQINSIEKALGTKITRSRKKK